MADLVRDAHEILRVETINTGTQLAVVRTHHTMFAHVSVTAPTTATVGQPITVEAQLVRWDDRTPITDEERELVVMVDGHEVDRLTTSGGAAAVTLQWESPGTYVVEVTGDQVTGTSVEVTVS